MERKIGGHTIFDDQNVGSHKTTDSVFIFFQRVKTVLISMHFYFTTCLGARCIGCGGGHTMYNFCHGNKGVTILLMLAFKFGTPLFQRK